MIMRFLDERRGGSPLINITSLIDVMFLLLIFFMVSTTFKDQPAINLQLPRSATAEMTGLTPALLTLTAGGEIYLNDRRLDEPGLAAALRQLRAASQEDRIILQADARSEHGTVVRLIDLVKQSGFTRVSLSARRPDATAGPGGGG